jgi:hypothetical protein
MHLEEYLANCGFQVLALLRLYPVFQAPHLVSMNPRFSYVHTERDGGFRAKISPPASITAYETSSVFRIIITVRLFVAFLRYLFRRSLLLVKTELCSFLCLITGLAALVWEVSVMAVVPVTPQFSIRRWFSTAAVFRNVVLLRLVSRRTELLNMTRR